MESCPRDELACLNGRVVGELTSMFGEACEAREWTLARETGEHVSVIYGIVYGWRHPLVGTSSITHPAPLF